MSDKTIPYYQIDARWKIVRANEAFCRILHCTESTLVGRDVRDLLREDWRLDFRAMSPAHSSALAASTSPCRW